MAEALVLTRREAQVYHDRAQVAPPLYPAAGTVESVDRGVVVFSLDEPRCRLDEYFAPAAAFASVAIGQRFTGRATITSRDPAPFWIGEIEPLADLAPEEAAASFAAMTIPVSEIRF